MGLAGLAGFVLAQETEYTVVGTSMYQNIKYYPTNCYNTNTGAHTNEFWTVNHPSSPSTVNTNPDDKYYADTNGNLVWEGQSDLIVTDQSLEQQKQMQVKLNANAHSQDMNVMVGALQDLSDNALYPCYVTDATESRVDFQNGWVCYRLYTCSTVPHAVSSITVSQEKTTLSVTDMPYENLMAGLLNEVNAAGGELAEIHEYSQIFQDMEGNTLSFTSQVTAVSDMNLFWTVNAAANLKYSFGQSNPAAVSFDDVYAAGTIFGDASFPSSASIVTWVGLDHVFFSKIDFFQTGFSPAPPTAACSNNLFGIGSGAAGILSSAIGVAALLAAPETGGASLALAAGIAAGAAGAASGGLGIASSAAC